MFGSQRISLHNQQAHFPKTINIGDVTQYGDCTCGDVIPWDHLPQVDVITAGYPCQPFSESGNRKGTSDERNLWPYVRDAICSIQPARVVLENVRGHLSLGFDVVLADCPHGVVCSMGRCSSFRRRSATRPTTAFRYCQPRRCNKDATGQVVASL